MSRDGWSSSETTATEAPTPRRRPFPRWLILVFILDAILVAGVIYWVFGRNAEANGGTNNVSIVDDVQGAPIDAGTDSIAAVAETDDDGFSDWNDSDDPDDSEWGDPDSYKPPTVSARGLSSAALQLANQKDLPRPEIKRPEHADYAPASFEDIGNWKYTRSWSGVGLMGGDSVADIPKNVLAWGGRKIAIQGFMLPLALSDENRVKTFMLMRNQAACCFGAPITLADWIEVTAPEGTSYESMLHKPITVLGELDVGEKLVDDFAVSVFRMMPDKILPPGESP